MKQFLKKWLGPIIILVTLAIVLIVGIVTGTLREAVNAVTHANPLFIGLCILCYFGYLAADAAAITSFLKTQGYTIRKRDAFAATLTGVYYANITPGATGGQPMQIHHLRKSGIPVGIGTSAVAVAFISWHIMRVVLMTVLGIPYWDFIVQNLGNYWPFLLLGYVYNIILTGLWVLFCFSKRPVAWLMRGIAKIATKLHLSKNPEKLTAGLERTAERFHSSMKAIRGQKGEIAKQLLFGTLNVICLTSIMYFAYLAVGLRGASYGQITVMSIAQYTSAAYMPTPGAAGAQEAIFGLYFGQMMQGSKLLAVMLIWRFMSFYLGLILGAVGNLLHRRQESPAKAKVQENI